MPFVFPHFIMAAVPHVKCDVAPDGRMKKVLYTKILDMQKESTFVKLWWFNCKTRELVKQKYPDEAPPLSHDTDGLKAFVNIIEYPFQEKLTLLKIHQQLYVPLLRNSM